MKYKIEAAKNAYRLTLTSEAFALAVAKSKTMAGVAAYARCDGRWDVLVTQATASLLKEMAQPGENLSDIVVKILSKETA